MKSSKIIYSLLVALSFQQTFAFAGNDAPDCASSNSSWLNNGPEQKTYIVKKKLSVGSLPQHSSSYRNSILVRNATALPDYNFLSNREEAKEIDCSQKIRIHAHEVNEDNKTENFSVSNNRQDQKECIVKKPIIGSSKQMVSLDGNSFPKIQSMCTALSKKSMSTDTLAEADRDYGQEASFDVPESNEDNDHLTRYTGKGDKAVTGKKIILLVCPRTYEFDAALSGLRDAGLEDVTKDYSNVMAKATVKKYGAFCNKLCYNDVNIILCKVGKYNVRASVLTSRILALVEPEPVCVVLLGVCASLNINVPIGAILTPSEFCTHEMGRQYDGIGHNTIGKRYRKKETGPHFNHFYLDKNAQAFEASKKLLKVFENVNVAALSNYRISGNDVTQAIEMNQKIIECGVCSSGSVFVHSSMLANFIRKNLNANIVDMESYGVAAACHVAGVEFAAIRVVSDHACMNRVNSTKRQSFNDVVLFNLRSAVSAIIGSFYSNNFIWEHKSSD